MRILLVEDGGSPLFGLGLHEIRPLCVKDKVTLDVVAFLFIACTDRW
jgi:hypothetical protein